MISSYTKIAWLAVILVTSLAAWTTELSAQTNRTTAAAGKSARTAGAAANEPNTSGAERKARALPYRGKLVSVDKQRNCLTVGTRVFHVTAKTRIESAGKSATLADGVPGQIVTGSYRKLADGKLEAASVYFGGKTSASPAGQSKTGKAQASATAAKQ